MNKIWFLFTVDGKISWYMYNIGIYTEEKWYITPLNWYLLKIARYYKIWLLSTEKCALSLLATNIVKKYIAILQNYTTKCNSASA